MGIQGHRHRYNIHPQKCEERRGEKRKEEEMRGEECAHVRTPHHAHMHAFRLHPHPHMCSCMHGTCTHMHTDTCTCICPKVLPAHSTHIHLQMYTCRSSHAHVHTGITRTCTCTCRRKCINTTYAHTHILMTIDVEHHVPAIPCNQRWHRAWILLWHAVTSHVMRHSGGQVESSGLCASCMCMSVTLNSFTF